MYTFLIVCYCVHMESNEVAKLKEELLVLRQMEATKTAAKDFPFFLEKFVYTHDEHDSIHPTKKFPPLDYLMDLAKLFVIEDKVLVEKSRQMMVSWIACSFALWLAMFHEGKRVFIQSKKEADANALLDRCKFIYRELPEVMRIQYPANKPMPYCKMQWGKQNSIIQAIPQGADVLRQYTSSLIISDEMAFQEKAEEAYIAARPTLIGGGKFIGISSPNYKEFFYQMVGDKLG